MPTRTHGGAINGAIKDLYATVANRCRIERSRLYGQYTNDEQLDLNSVSFTLTWAAIDALLLAATADVVLIADALPRWLWLELVATSIVLIGRAEEPPLAESDTPLEETALAHLLH